MNFENGFYIMKRISIYFTNMRTNRKICAIKNKNHFWPALIRWVICVTKRENSPRVFDETRRNFGPHYVTFSLYMTLFNLNTVSLRPSNECMFSLFFLKVWGEWLYRLSVITAYAPFSPYSNNIPKFLANPLKGGHLTTKIKRSVALLLGLILEKVNYQSF